MQQQKAKRYRGVILTDRGWHEFQTAKVQAEFAENAGDRFTLEELSERMGLSLNTIVKVLGRTEPADKQSLQWAFRAFGLELSKNDYSRPRDEIDAEIVGGASDRQNRSPQPQTDCGNAIDTSIFGVAGLMYDIERPPLRRRASFERTVARQIQQWNVLNVAHQR